MDHPNLANGNHKGKPYWPAVLLGVMTIVIHEVRGRKRKRDEVGYILGSEFSAGGEVRVIIQESFYVGYGVSYGDGGEESGSVI